MSNLILQFILVAAVFAIVLGGSYPFMLDARRQEQFNHYPEQLSLQDSAAQFRYKNAEAHPEKIHEFIEAGDEMASVLLRQQKFGQAIEIYNKQMRTTWGLVQDGYNPDWVNANLKLGNAFRDASDKDIHNRLDTALLCYQSALDLDRKYLPVNDPKIARELNNIGLVHYLKGMGQAEDKNRQPEFDQAIKFYKQSLDILSKNEGAKTAKSAALWNLVLAERDAGNKADSETFKKQAQEIDASFHRVCKEP